MDTSIAAYESIKPYVGNLRDRILDEIELDPATCDEIEEIFDLRHQTASARIRELVLLEKIYATDERRPTRSGRMARVYAAR